MLHTAQCDAGQIFNAEMVSEVLTDTNLSTAA